MNDQDDLDLRVAPIPATRFPRERHRVLVYREPGKRIESIQFLRDRVLLSALLPSKVTLMHIGKQRAGHGIPEASYLDNGRLVDGTVHLSTDNVTPRMRRGLRALVRSKWLTSTSTVRMAPMYERVVLAPIGLVVQGPRTYAEAPHLVLFHGTSSYAAQEILTDALQAIPWRSRVWKGRSSALKQRAVAVYLTRDVRIAKSFAMNASQVVSRRKHPGGPPVVLRIVVPREDYRNLRADDNWLLADPSRDPRQWEDSLEALAMVAYFGSIPRNRIEVVDVEAIDERRELQETQ